MTDTLAPDLLLRLRMSALGLDEVEGRPDHDSSGSGAERIAETARRMLAVQGQDWRSARWALGLRTPGTTVGDVHEAFDRGLVVRSWPMRGTIHLLPAEDIGWMQSATNRRVLAGAPKRREFLGMSDETLDRLVEVSVAALSDGRSLDRDELSMIWTEAGIEWKNNWRYHLIWWLCQNGLAVFGPVTSGGGEPRLVAADRWIASPRKLEGDDALQALAARYAAARGAVSAKDFAWWTGLTAGEAKRGLTSATEAGLLVQLESSGEKPTPMWAAPVSLDSAERSRGHQWMLLPAFDEHLLGFQNREPQLGSDHFERIVPGRNGMFLATIVRDGRVVGTWKKGTRRTEGLVGTPFPEERLEAGTAQLQLRADAWARFHGLDGVPFSFAG